MNKITSLILIVVAALAVTSFVPNKAHAAKISASSAAFTNGISFTVVQDDRVQILHDYLERYNSPLAPSAKTFVEQADKYNLDWRLVAAISGLESGFGKQIPPNSYNGWGWGIYGNNVKYFSSWDEAIETISEGLRENYIDKMGTDNIYSIGRIYAASPTWAVRVEHFMMDISRFKNNWTPQTLSVSI
jgi:hypothetical protein